MNEIDINRIKQEIKFIYEKFFKRHLKGQVFILTSMLITTGLSLIEPTISKILIDDVIGEEKLYILKYVIAAFVGLFLLNTILGYFTQKKNISITNIINIEIKTKIIESIQSKINKDYSEERSDRLVTITQDVFTVSNFINDVVLSSILHFGNVVMLTIYLMHYSIALTGIILINALIQVAITYYFSKPLRENYLEFKENSEAEFSFLNSTLINLKLIKGYVYEKRNIKRYDSILDIFKKLTFKSFKLVYSQTTILSITNVIGHVITISLGTYFVLNGEMTLGIFVVFLTLADNIKGSLGYLVSINTSLQHFIVSIGRVYNLIFDSNNTIEENLKLEKNIEEILIKDLKFSYEENIIFDGLNAHFKCGQAYIFVGENGVGKSTLINILSKFNNVDSGQVFFNNEDINNISDIELRNCISVAFQKNCFIDDTIKENLLLGNENATIEDINKILELTCCKDFIDNLEKGIETKMDDSNNVFSGGELQKLSIARTLLKSSDVYIFDEVFSNLDSNSKFTIFENINNTLRDKIVIFITHDEEILQLNNSNVFIMKERKVSKLVS